MSYNWVNKKLEENKIYSKPIKIVAIFGESGSGKDSIMHHMIDLYEDANQIISTTTRLPRAGEINGFHYHFCSNTSFFDEIINDTMLEATEFNCWYYGTSINSLDPNKINIGVFNKYSIENLLRLKKNIQVFPVYICANSVLRLQRSLSREAMPNVSEICRRYLADENDFNMITFDYDIIVNNSNNSYPDHDIFRFWAKVVNS